MKCINFIKILVFLSCFLLMGCPCKVCPPTTICPTPPIPREVTRPKLLTPTLKLGESPGVVIKYLQDDLGRCIRYSDELNIVLQGYTPLILTP